MNLSLGLIGGRKRYPAGLLSLWNAKTPTTCPVGPQIQTSVAGNQPDANGNMVSWPVLHPGKGVMVQPAYSQMLQNSKFEGAVSGTPGTPPTNWSNGSGIATPYTLTVSGTSLQYTASNSRMYHILAVPVTLAASLSAMCLAVCDGVLPIDQIIRVVLPGATITRFVDGVAAIAETVPSAGTHTLEVKTTGGTEVSITFVLGAGALSTSTGTVTISNPQLVASPYQMPYAASGAGATTSVTSTAATSGGNGLAIPLNAAMTAALSGGAFTAAALVKMGVSSAQVTAPVNILSANDIAAGLIYADAGGKLKSTDGTTVAEVTITGGWGRTDELLIVKQTNTAGAAQRIGYAKNTLAAITWGTAVAYDGSQSPLNHARIGLNTIIPFGARQTQLWAKSASDAEILKITALC